MVSTVNGNSTPFPEPQWELWLLHSAEVGKNSRKYQSSIKGSQLPKYEDLTLSHTPVQELQSESTK